MTALLFIYITRMAVYLAATLFAYKYRNYWLVALGINAMVLGSVIYLIGNPTASAITANAFAFLLLLAAINTRNK